MEHVTSSAVWGSLIASALLGAFMWIQAVADRERRWRYAGFATAQWLLTTLDFLHFWFDPRTYELLRIFTCSLYGASVVLLLESRFIWVSVCYALPCLAGLALWIGGRPELATTATLPATLSIAGVAHVRHYLAYAGYSSAVLAALTFAMALSCSAYAAALSIGDARIIALGYAHWAALNVLAVLFGWVHLPREIRGKAPVLVQRPQAGLFFGAIVGLELAVLAGLMRFFTWPPTVYLVGNLGLLVTTVSLYLYHRHRLVIYADNVTALLEERTESLRVAQEKLARQYDLQAQKLKEQERELQAKSEVIERQRRLELAAQSAGQAAHDIQNLIAPILVHLSDLDGVDGRSRQGRDSVGRIRRQVQELLTLNGQLLTLSRRGRMDFHPVRLRELLSEVESRFPRDSLELSGHDDPWVKGSWAQLCRAVSNLVSNAIEVAPKEKGAVAVSCQLTEVVEDRRCHLGFLSPGTYATVSIRDSGPGIPPEFVERIFEPFFSGKKPGERHGSGLGLAIVAAVVGDHRGAVDLETGSQGSRFLLHLPAIAEPSAVLDETALRGDATLLVAEDHTPTLEQVSTYLEAAGYAVLQATDGAEALHILTAQSVDLLLLDLAMPRLGGLQTFHGALHLRPGIRAVVHTNYVTSEDVVRLKELGVSSILAKPAGRLEILRAVRQALDEPRPS
ncbi:MAG: response regulator [Candidatus Riflebacteria bacterium]|nr:response regulator [Candidatus Riflebacteria bacterium]